MKNTAKAAAIGLPAITGYLTFLLSGVLMWLFMMYYFLQWWGLLGIIAALLLPPLSVLFPFIYWAQDSFPIVYFLIWLTGVVALTVGVSLSRFAIKRIMGRSNNRQERPKKRPGRSDIIEGEIIED